MQEWADPAEKSVFQKKKENVPKYNGSQTHVAYVLIYAKSTAFVSWLRRWLL